MEGVWRGSVGYARQVYLSDHPLPGALKSEKVHLLETLAPLEVAPFSPQRLMFWRRLSPEPERQCATPPDANFRNDARFGPGQAFIAPP